MNKRKNEQNKQSNQTKRKIGLKQKLIVYLLLIGIIPVAVAGTIIYQQTHTQIDVMWDNQLDSIAALKAR